MDRAAVFVDAGYLFAQGSVALTGAKKGRAELTLDTAEVVKALKAVALEKARGRELLRIYWYDGVPQGREPTTDHTLLANMDDVKTRLGVVNMYGEQKGVDSLIVTDLIELARNQSIADAVLLSGDEDVRIGVQIAQSYGVRIHLLGIYPARGSQSKLLLQEADTTSEWTAENVKFFLAQREPTETVAPYREPPPTTATTSPTLVDPASGDMAEVESAVHEFADELVDTEINKILEYRQVMGGIPQEFDRRLLAICGNRIDRRLDPDEIRKMRYWFFRRISDRPRLPPFDPSVGRFTGVLKPVPYRVFPSFLGRPAPPPQPAAPPALRAALPRR